MLVLLICIWYIKLPITLWCKAWLKIIVFYTTERLFSKSLTNFTTFFFLSYFFFFGGVVVLGIELRTLYLLDSTTSATPSVLLAFSLFFRECLILLPGPTWDCDSPISASWVTGIIDLHHHVQTNFVTFWKNRLCLAEIHQNVCAVELPLFPLVVWFWFYVEM
jgi:hypothetical protein